MNFLSFDKNIIFTRIWCTFLMVMGLVPFFINICAKAIYLNDYLNPYTLTFKNPKTIQMLNIIILYHYVMAFLVGVVIFTFIFIFISFFRSYPFFYWKPRKGYTFLPVSNFFSVIEEYEKNAKKFFHGKKIEYMEFYKRDIKSSINDQITHAPILEFLWVVLPAIILVFIAYPSVMMLYYNEMYVTPLYNITASGNQWYWTYEYNDFNTYFLIKKTFRIIDKSLFIIELKHGVERTLELISTFRADFDGYNEMVKRDYANTDEMPEKITIDSNLIIASDPKFLRLLSTDQCLVIPSKTPIRILVTSNDVIHSWAVPSYGVKMDAVPGRVNQQLLNIPLTGTSWGQCSELCGVNHAYMPIEVKVLSFGDFLFYIELKLKEIILPYLLNFYKLRINILLNFVDHLRNHINCGELEGTVTNKKELERILNSKNLLKFYKEN